MKRLLFILMLTVCSLAVVAWSVRSEAAVNDAAKKCCRGNCNCQVNGGCCPDTHCLEDGYCM